MNQNSISRFKDDFFPHSLSRYFNFTIAFTSLNIISFGVGNKNILRGIKGLNPKTISKVKWVVVE